MRQYELVHGQTQRFRAAGQQVGDPIPVLSSNGGLAGNGTGIEGSCFDAALSAVMARYVWSRCNTPGTRCVKRLPLPDHLPETLRSRWETGIERETSSGRFNHKMKVYNQALTQFPASLIVGLLALKPAGQL
jgi:hypothetical protein